ncbi:type II toxin-antitoxin system VapC family toxin (plasmid) [Azospirillum oryzae]|uniref:Type II toxin-antitoxin system VapC family toxin n=1 Tax=Azospirillum oryzae TaxID=286727 RepID=A0A6N1AFU5_9PROT|nr:MULTISPECIES: type II toxin-antitoxin system VapC family toxin [Azospirillum]KAA0578671.1 type II toxin-antitoxin system VapC family toxin [Azospirillum sp. Sh1]KAA0587275.1 type II toxin-antitoxin system VapC family toxin [Azospirillum oryzae]QKS50343.1 type II toxin-antitoxin system VapC family toxin [Azospirillum oryzae]GLR82631.1 DNA-binding protein [Azospirillum oryzae]
MTLVDTNVLLDLVTNDPVWADWSIRQLDGAAVKGPLIINDVVYAELSVGFERIEDLDDLLDEAGIAMEEIPREALFLAGKAFRRYRTAGGARSGVLPDFFIGAHAAVLGLPLLTRDAKRYRSYFPSVVLMAPEAQ